LAVPKERAPTEADFAGWKPTAWTFTVVGGCRGGTFFMAPIKEEDFLFKSDIEIVHRPTGANISTYRYPDPADACSTITVSFGPDDSKYDRMDIVRAAYELLRQKARGA
jgi:hypothetical protein